MDLVKWAETMSRGHLPETSSTSIREHDDSDKDVEQSKVAKKEKSN